MSQQVRRSKLGRRLQRLETRLTDSDGLVPHSLKWRAYWTEWLQRLVDGKNPLGKIPEEAYRALIDDIVLPPPPEYDDE